MNALNTAPKIGGEYRVKFKTNFGWTVPQPCRVVDCVGHKKYLMYLPEGRELLIVEFFQGDNPTAVIRTGYSVSSVSILQYPAEQHCSEVEFLK